MFSFFKKKPAAEPELELSANFNNRHVGPYLERVSRIIDSGFGDAERQQVLSTPYDPATGAGAGAGFKFPVRHQGKDSTLQIAVVPESVSTVILCMGVHPTLHAVLDEEMTRFFAETDLARAAG